MSESKDISSTDDNSVHMCAHPLVQKVGNPSLIDKENNISNQEKGITNKDKTNTNKEVDIHTFIVIEDTLTLRLQQYVHKQLKPDLAFIKELVNQGDYLAARRMIEKLGFTVTDSHYKTFKLLAKAAIKFGATRFENNPSNLALTLNTTDETIAKALRIFIASIKNVFIPDLQNNLKSWVTFEENKQKEEISKNELVTVTKAKSLLKDFTSFKDVTEASARKAQLISSLHTSRLSAYGYVLEAGIRGFDTYTISAQLDNRICPVCRIMQGKIFKVAQAKERLELIFNAQSDEELKQFHPWPSQTEEDLKQLAAMSNDDLVGRGFHLSPFHPACYAEGTKVFTERGFIDFREISIKTDRFLSLNPETKQVEYVKAVAQTKYETNKLKYISNSDKTVSLLVSDNHPMFYQVAKVGEQDSDTLEFVTTDIETFSNPNKVVTHWLYGSSKWVGLSQDRVTLSFTTGTHTFKMEPFLKFLGYYFNKGIVSTKYKDILISYNSNFQKYWDDLVELGVPISVLRGRILIKYPPLTDWCLQFGEGNTKQIPNFIKELTPDQIELFLKAYGLVKSTAIWNSFSKPLKYTLVFESKTERIRDDLIELLIKLGLSVSYEVKDLESKETIWVIRISTEVRKQAQVEDYLKTTMVYDVELEKNHTLLVAYKGNVIWGSNCRCLIVKPKHVPTIEQTPSYQAALGLDPSIAIYKPNKWDFEALGLPSTDAVLKSWEDTISKSPRRFIGALTGIEPNLVSKELLAERGIKLAWKENQLITELDSSLFGVEVQGSIVVSFDTNSVSYNSLTVSTDADITKMLANQIAIYKNSGIRTVVMDSIAEGDLYQWAKYGFQPTKESWGQMIPKIKSLMEPMRSYIDPEVYTLLEHLLAVGEPSVIWAIADLKVTIGEVKLGYLLLSKLKYPMILEISNDVAYTRFQHYFKE